MNWLYDTPIPDSYEKALNGVSSLADFATVCSATELRFHTSYIGCYRCEKSLILDRWFSATRYTFSYLDVIARIVNLANPNYAFRCFDSLMSLHFMNKEMNEDPIL